VIRDWEGELTGAATSFDWLRVAEVVDDYVRHLRSAANPAPAAEVKAILQLLRDNLRYAELRAVADTALAWAPGNAPARRQYAQALVDGDNPAAALLIYCGIAEDATTPAAEQVEARGGVGRCYKQLFVVTANPDRRAEYLRQALQAYLDAYREDGRRIWHGINAVALLARAERDGLPVAGDAGALAEEVLATVENAPAMDAWAHATVAEAMIALGRSAEATQAANRFVNARDGDAFKVTSFLRQLVEIWQLDTSGPPGDTLLPLLRSRLLDSRGGGVRIETGDVRAELVAEPLDAKLEKVLGHTRFQSLTWYRTGLVRCRAVAQVVDGNDDGIGTGFLVRGPDLHLDLPPLVFMTNGHVVPEALLPGDARVVFRGLDADGTRQDFRVARCWWYRPSGASELDTTLLELDAYPAEVEPVPLASRLPALMGDPRAYLIGHPRGLAQPQFSLQDNALLDYDDTLIHYRSPTEGGSSGSPVFDYQWNLIGLHHAGGLDMPQLHGRGGTYAANEAIALKAITAVMQATPPEPKDLC
jgi:Trypsin-like peptidase domain/Tetratricopeptide Repeats-Sensor